MMSLDSTLLGGFLLVLGWMLRSMQAKTRSEKLDAFFAFYEAASVAQRRKVHEMIPVDPKILKDYEVVLMLEIFLENGLDDAIKYLENEI